jgi:predicted RNase H-like nuclease (RuvC/YqgF family)
MIDSFVNQLSISLIKSATGSLLTKDQIQKITSHSVGRYLKEFLPEDEDERDSREKVEAARAHIANATSIISDIRSDLDSQSEALNSLLTEIEEKKKTAEEYKLLVETNQDAFAAMRRQLEDSVRAELTRHSEEGRAMRRAVSGFITVVTLVVGAALGAYFKDIVAIVQNLI